MRTAAGILVATLIALIATAQDAAAAGFATDDSGRLFQIWPDEKKSELVGVVKVTTKVGGKTVTTTPTLTDLALSDLHGLYGISFTSLYKIDMRDPSKSKLIGNLKGMFGQFNALAFDPKGRLFALEYGTLYQVNLVSGRATPLGGIGGTWGSDGDLAWIGDALYATVNGASGCHLVRLDPKTHKARDIGRIREAPARQPRAKKGGKTSPGRRRSYDDVWGLIWDGRTLWALTPQGDVVSLNLKTAVATPRFRARATYYGACPMIRI